MAHIELAPPAWKQSSGLRDITCETAEGIAKITICRPEVRNAFRPQTLTELARAFELARDDTEAGVITLAGNGPDAFCSGGGQRIRGEWRREIMKLSPLALRMTKAGFNAAEDGLAGVQQLAGDATLLFCMTEEAQEGRDAFVEKHSPDFSRFPRRP